MSQLNETVPAEEAERPFQFTLKTMFVITFVWAVFCAVWTTSDPQITFFFLGAGCALAGVVLVFCDRERLGTWLIGGGLLVFLILMLGPIAPSAPEAARRRQCFDNLKRIAIALKMYEDYYGRLPPAYIADKSGKPMHSWRVLLLPYLDQKDLYEQYSFDEPWDGPNNKRLHDMVLSPYRCPSEFRNGGAATCYVAVVGPKTMFPGEASAVSSDVPDGDSSTIMLVEIFNSGIHWMEPRDLNIDRMAFEINSALNIGQCISSSHPGSALVLFADGSARAFGEEQLTPEHIQALLSRNGGEEVDDILDY